MRLRLTYFDMFVCYNACNIVATSLLSGTVIAGFFDKPNPLNILLALLSSLLAIRASQPFKERMERLKPKEQKND